MKKYLKYKILDPLLGFLKQGMSPKKLALTLALGITFGIMPFMGVSTYLLIIIALIFKLNIAALQIVNYAVYVIQITLFVPFLKFGQFVFNGPKLPFDLSNVIGMLQTKFWVTLDAIWQVNALGLVVWAILIIPLGLAIYYASLPFFVKKQQKFALETVSVH